MTLSAHVDPGVQPGQVLAGKYVVDRVLGAGGMGVVVAAHHIQLDERVALKFLLPQARDNPDAVARFSREARAAAKIKNEHVARVRDVGTLDNGLPYMVMEYLEGRDLAAWLTERGPLPVPTAVDFVLQACEAIADAHVLGIVHRDLKPSNLFCVRRSDGEMLVKVLDFGISKLTASGAESQSMTRTSAAVGSPLYMSPEQMRSSRTVDLRTDIYALGGILFELASGRTAFSAETIMELALVVTREPAPPLRSLVPDVPPGLDAAVARCLEKRPEDRFRDVGELALAIHEFGSKRARESTERIVGTLREAGVSNLEMPGSQHRPLVMAPATATSGNAPNASASWGQSGAAIKAARSRVRLVVAASGAVAIVVIVGVAVASRMRAHAGGEPPTAEPQVAATATTTAMPQVTAAPSASAVLLEDPAPSESSAAPPPAAPAPATATVAHGVAHPVSSPGSAATTAKSAPPAASAPVPAPNCKPPYTVDSAGVHHYKPECM